MICMLYVFSYEANKSDVFFLGISHVSLFSHSGHCSLSSAVHVYACTLNSYLEIR